MDMISKLPPTIIENILCLVPIQEAARTSILSKEWRCHWTKIPKLVFEENTFQVSSYGDELSALEKTYNNIQSESKGMTKRCKLFYAIYQVLLKHEGPIHEFTLSMRTDKTCVEIDHIISYLSRNNTVKKLTLNIGEYRLPLSLFLFDHLTDLYLISCDLDHQPPFNGFYSLTNLFIEFVTTTKSTLLHLLSNCPLLKSLTVNTDDIQGVDDFTVTNLFECFPMVENLSTWLLTIKCFARDGVPHVLPTALIHLKYIYIDHMSFMDKLHGLPFLLFLIRSSPNLEKLKLQIFDHPWFAEPVKCSSTLENYSDIWLERLNVLEIFNLSNEKPELHFVKLILAKSPVLKKVRIFLWEEVDEDEELHISGILLSSQRASPLVEIVVGKAI